jgi:Flp pilus assembly protein TadD
MPDSVVLILLVIGGALGAAVVVAAFFIGAGYLAELRLPRAVRQERAAKFASLGDDADPLPLALEAVQQGTEDTCARQLRARATQAPTGPIRARVILALAYLAGSQGEDDQARQEYSEALKMAPALAGACIDLAGVYVRDGRDAAAEDLLTIALPVADGDSAARENAPLGYQLLGQILRRDERATEAEERLRQALTLYPSDAALMGAYGAALEALGRYEEAAQQYQEGMRLEPNDAMLHGQLGNLLMRQGAFDQANTHLELSADLFPDRPTTHVNLAALKLKMGEWDAAERGDLATTRKRTRACEPGARAPPAGQAEGGGAARSARGRAGAECRQRPCAAGLHTARAGPGHRGSIALPPGASLGA